MHWAKEDGQNVATILLDFERAFEKIEQSFLIGVLNAFGFPP